MSGKLEGTILHRFVSAKNLETTIETTVVTTRDRFGQAALHLAVRYGTLGRCLAIDIPWDLDILDSTGSTPLHTAATLNQPKDVARLLEAGASPHMENKAGKRPLDVTMSRKQCATNERARRRRDKIRSMLYKTEIHIKSALKR